MTHNRIAVALAAGLIVASAAGLRADVRADQKTRVTLGGMLGRMAGLFGGKAAKDGAVATVVVKGDRKATTTEQTRQIVDLAEEKIYDLDLKKKSYKVTTFAELRKRMEEARAKAAEGAQKDGTPPPDERQMEIDVDVKNTGQTKPINGFDTRQVVMTITLREKGKTLEEGGGLVTTTDMWLTPTVAAMREIAAFDMRYAKALYGGMVAGAEAEQMSAAIAMYPMMKQALSRMSVEGERIDGTAILTTVTMDAVKSAEQMARESSGSQGAASTPTSVGGLLGGLARKAAKKNDEPAQARAMFMTSTNEVLKISSDVAADDLAVPAGFKENK